MFQSSELEPELAGVLWLDSGLRPREEEPFEALVAEGPNHLLSVK